jgi:hypothetical protein
MDISQGIERLEIALSGHFTERITRQLSAKI